MRRCLAWPTLAAAPPKERLARWRTSTNTSGAVGRAHHQVDLTAAAPGRPIIARQQPQAARNEVGQCPVLGGVSGLLGGGGRGVFLAGEFH